MLGRLYLTGGKHEGAAKVAADLISTLPNHPAGYLLQGELDTQAGSFKEAVAQFERAHELDVDLLQPILASANVSMLQQDHVRAFQWYQQASNRHPNSLDVHVARGNYFLPSAIKRTANASFSGDPAPMFEHIRQNHLDILGILLTHAHFDHIAGIPYLCSVLPPPIDIFLALADEALYAQAGGARKFGIH